MKGCSCLVLSLLAFLSSGCFTEAVLGKDDPPPDDGTIVFHLSDSTHVTSPPGKHRRVDAGYEVKGTIMNPNQTLNTFEGIILNDDVAAITVSRYNPTGTVALICGVSVFLLLVLTRWGQDMP
jgi:hypothetical protein